MENQTCHTVKNNHFFVVSENDEKVIKLETDMWKSRIEITKDYDNQSNMELPLEYQDVEDNIYLNHENRSDKIFHCNICEKSFELNHLLKNHLAEHKRQINCKTNKCTFCEKKFKLKIGLNKHIQKHHNSVNGDHFQQQINIQQSSVLRQQSVVPTASQISMANNFNFPNIKQEKNLCTNVKERNSSDLVDSANSNESTLTNKPHDLMAEQNPINIANNNILSTVRETPYFCIRKLHNIKNRFCNDDYDQTSQNNDIFICKICKTYLSINIHVFALHMSDHRECNMHECIVCDKTFKSVVLWTNHMIYHEQEISNQVDSVNSNESTLANKETPYFCMKKLNNITNGFRSDDYDQTSQNNAIFLCKICENYLSTNIHAFALHMSDHRECNMHECIVCDKTFTSVVLWTNHMIYHEQEID
ncbi:unnamed protein product [Macrosiphum euphorbiae]|uniref:C2H2-type domain-containing protein n=1 Tax=Macrosiphum euphorbiae TaxID=13131 RepID=A0AAV0WJG6_9HEMI|nr:unnamed protein product [Macrosiphum euphorbiae]